MDMQLYIQAGKLYEPIVAGSVKWETSRFGEPGKLVFTVVKDDLIAFQEGARVHFSVDGVNLFYGFVFVKKRNKDHHIEVTAYDQLRYLKNKDTYVYTNKTATELLKMLAADFKLQTGSLEDTGFKIAQRVEDNTTLFDMVQNALDMTLSSTGKMYVLYDDFGRLTLKNIENMKLKTVIEEETAEDFDYTSSIDGETYNQIKLAYENGETGKREIYLVRDSDNISQWGVLQYFESIKEETNGAAKAEALLALHNRKTRNLTIKDALGDLKVRAGCSLPVILNLGDIINRSYLVCEKVTHKFEEGHHSMDLTMIGGDGFVG